MFAAQHGDDPRELPETVESLLTTRIDTLDPADRMLLRYAAVVGPTFELDLLGEILADEIPDAGHPERWAYLGEFIVPGRGRGARIPARPRPGDRLRGPLVPPAARHPRPGREALEQRLGTRADEEAALLSLHFYEAGDHARAWRYARAGRRAGDGGFANVVAAELYERALAAAEDLDEVTAAERVRVSEALGDVCERFAAYDRAFAALETARWPPTSDGCACSRRGSSGSRRPCSS